MLINQISKRLINTSILKPLEDIPKISGLPVIGTILSFITSGSGNKIHRYIDRRHGELGPILRESIGPVNAIFISDPDLMRTVLMKLEGKYPMNFKPESWVMYNKLYERDRGLFFMDGEEWFHYRKIMNKLLLKPEAECWLTGPITASVDNLIRDWMEKCEDGKCHRPNIPDDFYKLSAEMIISISLGSGYSSSSHKFQDLLRPFTKNVHKISFYSTKMHLLPAKYYAKFNFPAWKGFVNGIEETMKIGNELMNMIYDMNKEDDGLVSRMKAAGLNKNDITKIIIDLAIAANETTSGTIQWILYLLCKNPDILQQYRSVIDDPIEEPKFTRGIIKETMRLYPVAPMLNRFLPNDCELGGYMLPKGTLVVLSVFTASRSPLYFTDPLEFKPERWFKEDDSTSIKVPHATIPFAMGARSCIGRKISMIQIRELVRKITKNFNIEMADKNVEDVTQMILTPKKPLNIILKPRI